VYNDRFYPTRPYYRDRETVLNVPETPTIPDPDYSEVYGPYMSDREQLIARQAAQEKEKRAVLEHKYHDTQSKLEATQSMLAGIQKRLARRRVNRLTVTFMVLSPFVVVWGAVSILVQYPVLPWDIPSTILNIFSH